MEYKKILEDIEEQRRNEQLSVKLYRYTGLIQAIEFFSQKLNFEQIIDAAFDFVNEMLTVEKSAVFVLQDEGYEVRKSKGCSRDITRLENSNALQSLATLHGTLLNSEGKILKYFDKSLIDAFNIVTVIPLIMENCLYGFIFVSNKTAGSYNSEDYIIFEALMKLFNNALENYKRYEELQKANKELDEKIFNLFAINQSTKALLSEFNLDDLYSMSVDVFSELTQSSVTGFVLYDEKSEKYVLKAFRDVYYNIEDAAVSLTLNSKAVIDVNRTNIKISSASDVEYFNSIFSEGVQALDVLKPVYVTLLIKRGVILGFVTLGCTVTGTQYKSSIFELIESLVSSTYIALSNALMFNEVDRQKRIVQKKFDRLVSLNNLMKNINSSNDLDTLVDLTMKTLNISFDLEKSLFALYNPAENSFTVKDSVNINAVKDREIKINSRWKRVLEGDSVFCAKENGVKDYVDRTLVKKVGACPGILIVPIYMDKIDIDLLGVIIIFRYKNLLINDEESILTMETIAGHIAPVLNNLFVIQEQKKLLLPNYEEFFKRDLKCEMEEALEFDIDLAVVQVLDAKCFSFKSNGAVERIKPVYPCLYPVSRNNIFIITNEKPEDIEGNIKNLLTDGDVKIRIVSLRKEFNTYDEFLKLFE